MLKAKIISKHCEKSIINERKLLSKLNHPFIINLYYAFQDNEYLYLILDYLSGGDLRFHLKKRIIFTEKQSKFFLANLLLSLEYIHTHNIIHRDIKPENLIMDNKGYLRLTDFGIARIYNRNNFNDTSGTAGYMAPESLNGLHYTKCVDYYGMGVIGYELMFGVRPYKGKDREEIKENLNKFQACIDKNKLPLFWSVESAKLINGLLIKKPEKRLGYKNINEIKNHPWFKKVDWVSLYNKKTVAPFIPPQNTNNFDPKFNDKYEENKINLSNNGYNNEKINNVNQVYYEKAFIEFDYFPLYSNIKNKRYNKNNSQKFNSSQKKMPIKNLSINDENKDYKNLLQISKVRKPKILLKKRIMKNSYNNKNLNSSQNKDGSVNYPDLSLSLNMCNSLKESNYNSNNNSMRKAKKNDSMERPIIHFVNSRKNNLNSDRISVNHRQRNFYQTYKKEIKCSKNDLIKYYNVKAKNSLTKRTVDIATFRDILNHSLLLNKNNNSYCDAEKCVNISNNSIIVEDFLKVHNEKVSPQKILIKKNFIEKQKIVKKSRNSSKTRNNKRLISERPSGLYYNHDRNKSNLCKNTIQCKFSVKNMKKPLTKKCFNQEKVSMDKINHNLSKRKSEIKKTEKKNDKISKCLSGCSLYDKSYVDNSRNKNIIIDTYNKNINIEDWNKLKSGNKKPNSINKIIKRCKNQKKIFGYTNNSMFEHI